MGINESFKFYCQNCGQSFDVLANGLGAAKRIARCENCGSISVVPCLTGKASLFSRLFGIRREIPKKGCE